MRKAICIPPGQRCCPVGRGQDEPFASVAAAAES